MTNPYRRGAALEYLIKGKLEKEGWFVVRSAGSHGVADLVAIKHCELNGKDIDPRDTLRPRKLEKTEIMLISCKIGQYAPPGERKAILETASKIGATAFMTVKKGREWTLERMS